MPHPMPGRLFVFGLGFTALALARALAAEGWAVAGTTRSPDKAAQLRAQGIAAHLFDRGRPLDDAAAILSGTTHLLSTVPPDAAGDPVLDAHGDALAALTGLVWAGYVSTTGVYGDAGGAWVDEDSPLAPKTERGRRRVSAEAGWRRLGLPLHIFRLPGIYGPGRSALDALRAGTARRIDKPGHLFSRIHVEDIAGTLRASMHRPDPGAVYTVADDEPAASADVITYAAGLLGMAPPPLEPFDPATLSPMAASFYGESKRVDNGRIKRDLGVRLRYPDYRTGLSAQLRAERGA